MVWVERTSLAGSCALVDEVSSDGRCRQLPLCLVGEFVATGILFAVDVGGLAWEKRAAVSEGETCCERNPLATFQHVRTRHPSLQS